MVEETNFQRVFIEDPLINDCEEFKPHPLLEWTLSPKISSQDFSKENIKSILIEKTYVLRVKEVFLFSPRDLIPERNEQIRNALIP